MGATPGGLFDRLGLGSGPKRAEVMRAGGDLARKIRAENPQTLELAAGDAVRLQFEGWPAVQFVGWPSVARGTFGGRVYLVDPTANDKGEFRILVEPDRDDAPWPDERYLRQGVRVQGWVLLDRVTVGWELWRNLNGFPPARNTQEPKASQPLGPVKTKVPK